MPKLSATTPRQVVIKGKGKWPAALHTLQPKHTTGE